MSERFPGKAIELARDEFLGAGLRVRATGTALSLRVSDDLLGRVVDRFGTALDGKPLSIAGGAMMRQERIAHGVTKRAPGPAWRR